MALIPARVVARLLSNVEQAGDCTLTRYSTGSHGYGQIGWHDAGRRIMALAHRVAWEAVNGPIPDDLTVDHLCRNRRCINVQHLRLLTNVENARGNGSAVKTHCLRGHPFDDENTLIDRRTGHRYCRACARFRRKGLPGKGGPS